MPKKRPPPKAVVQEEEPPRAAAPSPSKPVVAQTFDDYQCSGNVKIDFPALCALVNLKKIPAVITKRSTSFTEHRGTLQIPIEAHSSKHCIEVNLENEDPLTAKIIKVSGWKVNGQIFQVLLKMLPTLSYLHGLNFWQAGVTDTMIPSLISTISLSSTLRSVTLEGNVLPKRSFHLLLGEDSVLTHLCLRNNRIGDEDARLIGAALSTTRSANCNLLSLNLSFNSIGDAGAMHIAQGLRLNRTLLFLSLSNNYIEDPGAVHLAMVLGEFSLTHEEVVERRKLLLLRVQADSLRGISDQLSAEQGVTSDTSLSVSKSENKSAVRKKESSRKDERPTDKEKFKKSEMKTAQSKGRRPEPKETQPHGVEEDQTVSLNKEQADLLDRGHPLLDHSVYCKKGKLYMPGNATLAYLDLAGNRITEKSLPQFLESLEMQDEKEGLVRLCLQRNLFPLDSECYVKIKKRLEHLDVFTKNSSELTDEEEI